MSEPMERHISITSTTTNTNGVVTQVTHASVHVVASGDCFDPETCCDERERALSQRCARTCGRNTRRKA